MKIKFVLFDWGGTLGKSGQRGVFVKSKRSRSLKALQSDTVQTLNELRKKGVRMGILSNTQYLRSDMHKGLVTSGLKRFFDFEIYSSDEDQVCGKPCKDIYASAYDIIKQIIPNIRKKQILYVGDNYYSDVMGAQNYGFSAAYIVNQDSIKYYLADFFGSQEVILYTLSDILKIFN